MPKELFETFKNLEGVKPGDTPMARLVYELCAADGRANGQLYRVFEDIAKETYTKPWTVYYWLKGKFRPADFRRDKLIEMAKAVGLDDAVVAALADEAPTLAAEAEVQAS